MPESLRQDAASLELLRQHRNTAPIWDFARQYTGAPVAADLPDGPPVRIIPVPDDKLESRLAHELSELRKAGAAPEDIAILTLAGQTLSAIWSKERLGSHPICHADDPAARSNTVCETFLRFKGLERPHVILTELAAAQGSSYETRMHIAATRATVSLTVVCSEDVAPPDERLAAHRDEG